VASYDRWDVAMRNGIIRILALALATLAAPRTSSAQCASINGISGYFPATTNAPFQATMTTTRTPPAGALSPANLVTKPDRVARDSQGRTRSDHFVGEVHVETGPNAGTDVDSYAINICDPVRGASIELDNVNRVATIDHLAPFPGGLFIAGLGGACVVPSIPKSPYFVTESLGNQVIEGFDAQGWRTTMTVPAANSPPGTTLQSITEIWCSEDLRAILLMVFSGSPDRGKIESALTKIERAEPDPALFQIPSGYTVKETLSSPRDQGPAVSPPVATH
jgi:hypothetical protein